MFPGAGAVIYRNEVGEPMGWDYPDAYEPDPGDPYDAYDEGPDGPFDGCCEQGDWNGPRTGAVDQSWTCSYCGEPIPWERSVASQSKWRDHRIVMSAERIRKYRDRAIRRGTLRS